MGTGSSQGSPFNFGADGSLRVSGGGGTDTPVSTASVTQVNSSATSQQLLAANADRKGVSIQNTDANALYVKFGPTASATDFTVMLETGDLWVMDAPIYTGRIDGIWAADGSGLAAITEL